jgi:ABC-type sugar transport system permease subunit
MPTELHVRMMCFSTRALYKVWPDIENPPQTWQEILEAARKAHNPPKKHGIGLEGGDYQAKSFASFIQSNGGKVLKQNNDGEWVAAFDDEKTVEALYFYWQLRRQPFQKNGVTYRGCSNLSVAVHGSTWAENLVRFFNAGSTLFFTEAPEVFVVSLMPEGPGGLRKSQVNCTMLALNSALDPDNPKDKEKIEATWEYLKFITSDEAVKIRVDALIEAGGGQFVNPILLEKYGYLRELSKIPEYYADIYRQAVENGVPEPYIKNTNLIYLELNRPLGIISNYDYTGQSEEEIKDHMRQVLKESVAITNKKLLGYLPPKIQANRGIITKIVVVVLFAGFLTGMIILVRQYKMPQQITLERRTFAQTARKYWIAYLMLIPAVGMIALWQYWPLIRGSIMAFQDYSVVGTSKWVGMENFSEVLFSSEFWASMGRTCIYAGLTLALTFPGPMMLAVLLQEVPRGKILFRVLFYLPSLTNGLIIMFLWKGFYDPSPAGILNRIVSVIGLGPFEWLQDPGLAMFCIIIPAAWAGLGGGCLIYLAALKCVPDELYEAAVIDGAGFFSRLRYIVYPILKPLIIINFVGAFIGAFKAAENIMAMSGAGPDNSTMVAGLQIFYQAFIFLKFGVATVMAWILGSFLVGFAVFQLRILNRLQFTTTSLKKGK